MTWTAIFIDDNGSIFHKIFVSSHTGRIAWEEMCNSSKSDDARLVCIVPGDHVPQSFTIGA